MGLLFFVCDVNHIVNHTFHVYALEVSQHLSKSEDGLQALVATPLYASSILIVPGRLFIVPEA